MTVTVSPAVPPDLPQPSAPAPLEQVGAARRFYYYCQNNTHPGSPDLIGQPFDMGRIFAVDTDEGCPICPKCNQEVSAVPCAGPSIPPPSVVQYARDFAAQQVRGGVGR